MTGDGPSRFQIPGSSLILGAVNWLSKTIDMTSATWNSDATHEVFTVTGVVRVRILCYCTETLADTTNNATISLGPETDADGWIADTDTDIVVAGTLWFSNTPATYTDAATAVIDKIVYGEDIGYEIDSEALVDGTLVIECWWEPLSPGASVVLGAGGVLA